MQDSQELFQILNKPTYNSLGKVHLYSCDFESHYTNIDLYLYLDLILEEISNNINLDPKIINLVALKELILLVYENNFFTYNNSY